MICICSEFYAKENLTISLLGTLLGRAPAEASSSRVDTRGAVRQQGFLTRQREEIGLKSRNRQKIPFIDLRILHKLYILGVKSFCTYYQLYLLIFFS